MSRTWTYAQLTAATEDFIRTQYRLAADDAGRRHTHLCFAMGAYLTWHHMTMGWQRDGDDARLGALARRGPAYFKPGAS